MDDVALTHLTFASDFTDAVEQKQIAEQRAEMARYNVEKAEQVKIANIIKAEGDAEAAQLIADVSTTLERKFHFSIFAKISCFLKNGD